MSNKQLLWLLIVLLLMLCLVSGCDDEPKPEPKFEKGQKVVHKATQIEYYIIDPICTYHKDTGWGVDAMTYDITQEQVDEWREHFSDVNKHTFIDGGKLVWREKMYESFLEPAEDDYRRY